MKDERLEPGDVVCFKADADDEWGPMTVGRINTHTLDAELYWLDSDYRLQMALVPEAALQKLAPEPARKGSLFSLMMGRG